MNGLASGRSHESDVGSVGRSSRSNRFTQYAGNKRGRDENDGDEHGDGQVRRLNNGQAAGRGGRGARWYGRGLGRGGRGLNRGGRNGGRGAGRGNAHDGQADPHYEPRQGWAARGYAGVCQKCGSAEHFRADCENPPPVAEQPVFYDRQ